MRFPPPEVIASWPVPDYTNPISRGPTLLIVELTILPVALICVALRLYVRYFMVRKTWWDDWLMVVAAIFGTGVTICVVLASQKYGWNIHVWDLTLVQMIQGRQVSIAGQTLFVFASGFEKLSILATYLRIAVSGTWFRRLTWASIVLVNLVMLVFTIVLWTQCNPASEYWNLFATDRTCEAEGPPLMGQASATVFTDLVVYILPMPTLYQLKLPQWNRIVLMAVFGLGGLVCVAGIMRTVWVHHVVYSTYDITWEGFYLWIWTAVEVNLGVICGCIPALRPLLSHWNGQRSGYSSSTIITETRRGLDIGVYVISTNDV
ncbi:hypothetical protein AOQ84DRAFT_397291 [Glonium stellatum]|uniref:Rhodopsin domain-containing protein n=1 Tax=Glonium stellatum TaxID=574774 RepID=A0A8E2JU12_9PEZI|nr:hypothetical protein AOQ84DRAFT_397291 [Glonium stellatum]